MIKVTDKFIDSNTNSIQIENRGRCNHNFHKDYSDKVHRFLNIINPGSYVRPHKHDNPPKVEAFIILRGRVLMLEFSDNGKIIDHIELNRDKGNFAAEIPAGVWHSLISLENNSALYEIKEGPYDPGTDKTFASWAPPEKDSEEAERFIKKILNGIDG